MYNDMKYNWGLNSIIYKDKPSNEQYILDDIEKHILYFKYLYHVCNKKTYLQSYDNVGIKNPSYHIPFIFRFIKKLSRCNNNIKCTDIKLYNENKNSNTSILDGIYTRKCEVTSCNKRKKSNITIPTKLSDANDEYFTTTTTMFISQDDTMYNEIINKYQSYTTQNSNKSHGIKSTEYQITTGRTTLDVPPEVNPAVSSFNYFPVNGNATPRDRGEDGGGVEGSDGLKSSTRPQVVTSSGLPESDPRELEGEINREGHHGEWKTSGGDKERTSGGKTSSRLIKDDIMYTSENDVFIYVEETLFGKLCIVFNYSLRLFSLLPSRTRGILLIYKRKKNRPAIALTSTSYSLDEDIFMLFEALKLYDDGIINKCNNKDITIDNYTPPLFVLLTGYGYNLMKYKQIANNLNLKYTVISFIYVPTIDYYNINSIADIGISMHKSYSGVDLPMKIINMQGCGLPVLSFNYKCISELIINDFNGYLFNNSNELFQLLLKLLKGFPYNFDSLFIKSKLSNKFTLISNNNNSNTNQVIKITKHNTGSKLLDITLNSRSMAFIDTIYEWNLKVKPILTDILNE